MFGMIEINGKKYVERQQTFGATISVTVAGQLLLNQSLVLPGVADFLLKSRLMLRVLRFTTCSGIGKVIPMGACGICPQVRAARMTGFCRRWCSVPGLFRFLWFRGCSTTRQLALTMILKMLALRFRILSTLVGLVAI